MATFTGQPIDQFSVEQLEAELDDAWGERAGDLTVGGRGRGDSGNGHRASNASNCGGRSLRGADSTPQIVVGVIENVVEPDPQALDGRGELLVQRKVGFVEGLSAARVASGVAEGAENGSIDVFDGRQDEGVGVDVVDVAGVGGAVSDALGDGLSGRAVGAILIGAWALFGL